MSAPGIVFAGADVILSDLILHSRVNGQWDYTGLDSPEYCLNIDYFWRYPHKVKYSYNSRGFRDTEWPESLQELQDAAWCVGDSFTVGIGSPFDHTWTQVLARRSKKRTINISMDGASNDWIYRRALQIHQEVNPRIMIVMWSYTHRREHPDTTLSDEQRRIYHTESTTDEDLQHWQNLVCKLRDQVADQNQRCELLQCTIPEFHLHPIKMPNVVDSWDAIRDLNWPRCPENLDEFDALPDYILQELKNLHGCYDDMRNCLEKELNDIIYICKCLDYARDYHHFDILTSEWVVDRVLEKIHGHTVSRNRSPVVSVGRSDLR